MIRSAVRCLVAAAVQMLAASASLGGQQPTTASDLPPQLSAAARQAIARLGDSLRAVRLPDEPLYAKAAEGVLKGAEEARIVAAVRTLARELGEARSSLGDAADVAELVAGASALHVGATPAMLKRLRETHFAAGESGTSLATPLVALADLLTRRVPPPIAAAAIDSLVARRAPGDDFAALRAAVERDIDAGRAPEASVTTRMQGLLRRRSP